MTSSWLWAVAWVLIVTTPVAAASDLDWQVSFTADEIEGALTAGEILAPFRAQAARVASCLRITGSGVYATPGAHLEARLTVGVTSEGEIGSWRRETARADGVAPEHRDALRECLHVGQIPGDTFQDSKTRFPTKEAPTRATILVLVEAGSAPPDSLSPRTP